MHAGDAGISDDNDGLEEPVAEKPIDDVRKCINIGTNMFDTDDDELLSDNDKEQGNMTDAEFLSTTRLNGRDEFDRVIKLWIKYMPEWKKLFPEELGQKEIIAATDLINVDLKVIMDDIGAKHPYGLIPLMVKSGRGQLGVLNAESNAERMNLACKVVMDEGNTKLSYELLDKLVTLRMNRRFVESRR